MARVFLTLVAVAATFFATNAQAQSSLPVSELAKRTHFHGLAVDPADPTRLLLATHHGIYVVSMDGVARRHSRDGHDFMGFSPHPIDNKTLYASGHPAAGGNLGFIASNDGGRSWRQVSPGHQGPVDFHQLDVSRSDPARIYGVYGGLQTSRDGGRTWQPVGPVPPGLIDLAVSPDNAEHLYAGTQAGLFASRDGGRSWLRTDVNAPVTLLQSVPDGSLYLFAVGQGLFRMAPASTAWQQVSNSLGDRVPIHLTAHPADARRLFVADHGNGLLESRDGGETWQVLGGQSAAD